MRRVLTALALLVVPCAATAQARPDSAFLTAFRWRSIGPANMSGRVVDIEANPMNPKVIFVAFATGGMWKSVNAGTTWTPIFDQTGAHAVSEVTIAPSDTSVLYAGTGEPNSRNSISPGNGVYKSTDAGRTWTHIGLRETQVIGRILVHPTDPNTVWVAALGRPWGPNPERGVFKSTDGGRTWRHTLAISDRAGVVEMSLDRQNPSVLYAAAWERVRGPHFLQSGGPGSGLHRSMDGGDTWTRVSGNGLPTTTWGRSAVAVAPTNGSIVYLLVEADSNPNPASLRRGYVRDSTARQRLQSGLFRSTDAGQTWTRMNDQNNRPFYYSRILIDPRNADRIYWLSTQIRFSNDAGRTYRQVGQGIHVDYHAIWINPNDPDHYIVGQDGGVAQTWDRGRSYDAFLQMPVGQFYAVGVDMQKPFWVCGGLQDNGTWCGPTETNAGGIRNEHWVNVNGGDGFYAAIDPTDADVVYAESQGGNVNRLNLRSWERRGIRPTANPQPAGGGGGGFGGGAGIGLLRDSIVLARGDTTQPATPEQQRVVDSLEARIARDTMVLTRNRFNWSSPFFLSSHNPSTIYMGGHRVWKSTNRGDRWVPISDDVSTRDTAKIRLSMARTGGVTIDATGAETHGTVTTIGESPLRPGILYAGTDDGNVWMTRNDGAAWDNLTTRFPGLPRGLWVSRVEPSHFDSATVYVTFDGHRSNDFRPHVYVSSDFGRTFRTIAAGIPADEYVHVIAESPRRRGLLFLGTELTAYVSADDGGTWQKLNGGLPPAPVHDLVVHPRDRALVAATHGRSFFVMDIGVLEQATDSLLGEQIALFAPEPALMYASRAPGGGVGARGAKLFSANNPPSGVRIPLRIRGSEGQMVARGGPRGPGADSAAGGEGEGGGGAGFGGGGAGFGGGGGGGGLLQLLTGGGAAARPAGDSVMLVITDVRGDTVRTLYTNARPAPLRWITWDMRRSRAPLSPSALRDSVRNATRAAFVRDSVRGTLRDTTRAGLQALMRDPEPGEPGTWSNPLTQGLGGGFGGGGGGGGGGFGGGGQGALVEPGTYLVTLRINGRDYKQTVVIERPLNTSALTGGWR